MEGICFVSRSAEDGGRMSTAGGSIRFYVFFAWDQDIWTDYIAIVHI